MHLASALALGPGDTILVTWDRDLSNAAVDTGLAVAPALLITDRRHSDLLGPRRGRTVRDCRPRKPWGAVIPALMPFTVDRAELARYASGLGREVAADLDGALGWFGADEDGPSVEISRYDLQQFVHYTLPRKYLADVEEHIAVARALGDALERLARRPTMRTCAVAGDDRAARNRRSVGAGRAHAVIASTTLSPSSSARR